MTSKTQEKSPAQSVPLRSPMEKHISSSSRSSSRLAAAAAEIVESDEDEMQVEGGGKISFSSPTSSKAGGSRSTTPSKATGSVSSKSRISASKSTTAAKKRKIDELETKESDIMAALEKLRGESKRVKARIARMEEDAMKVKFPMKDEVLMALCANTVDNNKDKKDDKGIKKENKTTTATSSSTTATTAPIKLEPLKDLPPAVLQLNTMLPEELVTDAIEVWDFINVFSKTLSLTSLPWEDFIDLLKYTDKPSLALTDLYCSLLRLILSDSTILTKISTYLPKKVNYAYRHNGEFELNPTGEVDFNINDLLLQDDYDCEYNGLKLLSRKIKVDHINSICYQAILRSVILRLEPVKQLRKAVLDITNVAHYKYIHNNTTTNATTTTTAATPGCGVITGAGESEVECSAVEYEEIGALVGLASAYKRQRTRTPAPKHSTTNTTTVPSTAVKSTNNNNMEIKEEEKERIPPQTAQKIIPTSLLASINTPKLKTKQQSTINNNIDKDAIYHITSNVTTKLQSIYDSADLLETNEIYQLSIKNKLILLKILCDSCLETSRIKQILNNNAEERYIQITNMNKSIKEMKLKQKEINNKKKDAAFQLCREINIKKAKIEEERLALIEKKKAASALKAAKKKKGATPDKTKENKTKKGKTSSTTATTAAATKKGGGGGSSKGGSKNSIGAGKDGLDPTAEQLAAMIEEMVVLSTYGVDFVEEIPLDLLESGDDDSSSASMNSDSEEFEYDKKGNLIQRAKRQRRTTTQTRVQALESKRSHAERRYKQELIQLAEERLVRSLEVHSEREMRGAIKQAERAGCKDYKDNGKCFCTPNMKAVYMKLYELETQAKEDKLASQHEKALQEYFVRTTPIGTDRYYNTYWSFAGDDRLFVQSRELLTEAELEHCPMPPQSGPECDPTLSRLFSSRPNRFRYKWSVYSSPTEQWLLWDALDDRGERESSLKAAVKARFDIEEPPVIYELTGSDYIGRKVRRVFGRKKPVIGLIVGWLPPTATDAALWHVQHLDGDEEDLEETEVEEYLLPLEDTAAGSADTTTATAAGSADGEAMDVFEDQPLVGAEKSAAVISTVSAGLSKKESSASLSTTSKQPNTTTSVASKKNTTEVVDSDEEAEFDEEEDDAVVLPTMPKEDVPGIIRQSAGLTRGIPVWRAAPLTNQLGAQAMRTELTRVLGLLNDEVKARGGGFTRETRKMWDHTLRDAETVVDFIGPVLELESLVRDLQTAEDKRDAEEVRLAKEAEKAEMLKEGWVFDAEASEFIGIKARRFFKGFGSSDGTVIAHLPADKNDGVALWHMEHNDGDAEDLELADLQKALRYFEQDLQEDEDDEESDGEDEGDEESSVGSEESDEEDAAEDRLYAPNRSGATLWPTYEVRQRWMAALSSSKTLGELGLALQGFMEQADAFGVLAPDPYAVEKELAPRKARLAARSSRRSVYVAEDSDSSPDSPVVKRSSSRHHRSSGSRSSSRQHKQDEIYGRERPSRAAARSVRSYAE